MLQNDPFFGILELPFFLLPCQFHTEIESYRYVVFIHISIFYMKQIETQQFNSNDAMSLHRDMAAVKTPNETSVYLVTTRVV